MKLTCLMHRVVCGFGSMWATDKICVDCGRRFVMGPWNAIILPDTRKNVVLANYAEGMRKRQFRGEKATTLEDMYKLFDVQMPADPCEALMPDLKHPGE